jgi:hypothetical protein
VSELLEAEDLDAMTVPQRVSAVAQGFARHLPTPQLTRDDLKRLRPEEINAARTAGMLADVLAGK